MNVSSRSYWMVDNFKQFYKYNENEIKLKDIWNKHKKNKKYTNRTYKKSFFKYFRFVKYKFLYDVSKILEYMQIISKIYNELLKKKN